MADSTSQIGDEIRQAREGAGLTQGELASAVGRDVQTISRWERGERQPKASDVERVRSYLAGYLNRQKVALGKTVPRQTISNPDDRQQMPDWLERRAVALDRELAKAGAVDSQLDHIQEILRSPAVLKLVLFAEDGSRRGDDDQRQQLELFIEGLRFWLERTATPGGAPIAPVTPTQDPSTAAKSAHQGRRK